MSTLVDQTTGVQGPFSNGGMSAYNPHPFNASGPKFTDPWTAQQAQSGAAQALHATPVPNNGAQFIPQPQQQQQQQMQAPYSRPGSISVANAAMQYPSQANGSNHSSFSAGMFSLAFAYFTIPVAAHSQI